MGSQSSSECKYENEIQDKNILGQKIIEGYAGRRDVYLWFNHDDLIFKTKEGLYFQFSFHCKEKDQDYQWSVKDYTEQAWEKEKKNYQTVTTFWELGNDNFYINYIDIEYIYKKVASESPYHLIKNNCVDLAQQAKELFLAKMIQLKQDEIQSEEISQNN